MEFGYYCHLLFLYSFLHHVSMATTGSYCTPGTTQPDPKAPPLPDLPPSFQTRLEANLVDRGFTMEAVEYADSAGNRGALTTINNGDLTILIYDYNASQIYVVHDGVCTTKNMSNDTLDDYLYGDISVNGASHVYSTNDIIKFAKRFGETYVGQSSVRGIWCDHWRSCMYWDVFKANFTLDYYFTALNWTTSMTYPQVPVRADVIGIMQTTSGSRNFHHIYDYYDFRPGIEPGTTAFETPPNVVCPNRKSLKLIPKLANQFYFRSEQTFINTGMTVNMQVWYDSDYRVVRADYGVQRPAIHIDDFNRGIQYVIDKEYGTCTMGPMPVVNQAGKKVGESNHWVLQLLPPLEFLRLQEIFVYVGQRIVRGLTCDLFVAQLSGDSTSAYASISTENATVEAYFSRGSEGETPDTGTPGDPDEYSHVLVQMIVYVNQSQFDNLASYYDFDFAHSNPEETFDLTPCYSDKQKIGFRIKFPVESATNLLAYNMEIKQKVLKRLSVGLHLEPTRVQQLQVHADDHHVYVSGKLLQRPPLLSRYYKIPNQSIELVDKQHDNVTSADECAELCDTDPECVSFALCSDTNTCYLSHVVQQYDPDNDGPLSVPSCMRYSVIVKRPDGLPDHDLRGAWMAFRNMVYTKGLVLQLDLPTLPIKKLEIGATEVIEDDIWKYDTTDFLQEIELYRAGAILVSPSSALRGVALDDCARHCVGDSKCLAFSYCIDDSGCQFLTDPVSPSEIDQNSTRSKSCFVYDVTANSSTPSTQTVTTASASRQTITLKSLPTSQKSITSTTTNTSKVTPSTQGALSTQQYSGTTTRNTDFILYQKDADFMSLAHTKIAKSVEECLEYCIQDTLCETITICERENKCHLSYNQPDSKHVNLVQTHIGCDVYTQSTGISIPTPTTTITSTVTQHMSLSSSSPGSSPGSSPPSLSSSTVSSASSVNPNCPTTLPDTGLHSGYILVARSTMPGISKVSRQVVASASRCGEYCNARTDFKCKAIQYCPGNQICNMLDTRQLPAPRQLKYETPCLFYTREFLTDFVKQISMPSGSQQFTPVKNMALTACADLCGKENTSCASFQYCPATQDCLIETTQLAIQYSSQTQTNCQYYKRSFSEDQQGTTENTGMIAGIAVGTLVLGFVIGAVVIYLIQRHRLRRNCDFDMQSMVTH